MLPVNYMGFPLTISHDIISRPGTHKNTIARMHYVDALIAAFPNNMASHHQNSWSENPSNKCLTIVTPTLSIDHPVSDALYRTIV